MTSTSRLSEGNSCCRHRDLYCAVGWLRRWCAPAWSHLARSSLPALPEQHRRHRHRITVHRRNHARLHRILHHHPRGSRYFIGRRPSGTSPSGCGPAHKEPRMGMRMILSYRRSRRSAPCSVLVAVALTGSSAGFAAVAGAQPPPPCPPGVPCGPGGPGPGGPRLPPPGPGFRGPGPGLAPPPGPPGPCPPLAPCPPR
jgi:hypothetical protein